MRADDYYKEDCNDERSYCVRTIHEACTTNPGSCERVDTNDGYTVIFLKGTYNVDNRKTDVEDVGRSVNGKMQGRLPQETPETNKTTPDAPITPSSETVRSLDANLTNDLDRCRQAAEDVGGSCSETNSLMNRVKSGLDSTSRQVAGWAQQSPQACNSMANNASVAFSSGMGAWKSGCLNAYSECRNTCEAIIGKLKAQGFSSYVSEANGYRTQCDRQNSQMSNIEQNMNDAKSTALAGLKCRQDALMQNAQNLSPNGLSNLGGGSSPGLNGGGLGSGFSSGGPATLGGSGRDSYGRDERATGAGGTSLADGAMDGGLGGNGREYEKSKIDQLSLGGAGGGVSGKVTYSDSSLPKPKNNQNYGGGGSSLNSTVNGGFYGGGGAMGSGAFRQAAIAPVGGYRPPNGNNPNGGNIQLNGKPDLRRFLPPGGPKRVAASPEGFQREDSKIGRDGVTGPRTSNFGKVRYRYNAHRATLTP